MSRYPSIQYYPVKKLTAIAIILGFLGCFALTAHAVDRNIEEGYILSSAESLFISMKDRNYPAIWNLLSIKSRDIIASDVYDECRKSGCRKEEIARDFPKGGSVAKTYWDSYLAEFDPDMVLEHSRWEMGAIKDKTAQINLYYKKSKRPAVLQMYKEEDTWKVGLEETFRARRMLN